MKIQHFYDQEIATFTYIVSDEKTQKSSETFTPRIAVQHARR